MAKLTPLNNSFWMKNPIVETQISATGASIDGEISELIDLISKEKINLVKYTAARDEARFYYNQALLTQDQQSRLSYRKLKDYNANIKDLKNQLNLQQGKVNTSTSNLTKWETIDLPKLQALKSQYDNAALAQTFAGQGKDLESMRIQANAQAEAEKITANAKADSQRMVAKSTSDALDRSSKTTRNIVVIVILAAVLISAYMIYKRRKK